MLNKVNEKHYQVSSSNLSKGVYIIEIKLESGKTYKESVFITKN